MAKVAGASIMEMTYLTWVRASIRVPTYLPLFSDAGSGKAWHLVDHCPIDILVA